MNKRAVRRLALVFVLFLLFAPGASSFADGNNGVEFSIDVSNVVLEMSVPSAAHITLDPITSSGDFDTATINVNVSTNNSTGYTLTMTSDSGDLDYPFSLIGTTGARIDNLSPTDPASTGYTQSSFTMNRWGYRVLNNENYYPVGEDISHASWVTDEPSNLSTKSVTLAAKVDGVQASDTYTTTIVFLATANSTAAKDSISFNGNGADGGTAMAGVVVYDGDTDNLPANTYTHTGMRFVGWSTTQSGVGGMVYGDEAPYTAPNLGVNRNVVLYAQWVPSSTPNPSGGSSSSSGTTIARAYEIAYTAMHKGMYEEQHENQGDYALVNSWPPTSEPYKGFDVRFALQDMTTEICNSVTAIGDSYGALDVRDNKIYNIVKSQDGRCWFQDSLAVNPTVGTTAANMVGNTNASSEALANLVSSTTPSNPYWSTAALVDADSGFSTESAPILYSGKETDGDPHESSWKTGIYYNICAISAGTYCNNAANDVPGTSLDIQEDLCPTGWRLPMADEVGDRTAATNEVAKLQASYSTGSALVSAMHMSGAGYMNFGTLYHFGEIYYWTATYDVDYDWPWGHVAFGSTGIDSHLKTDGCTARCIAK